jgi:sulfur-oxidizing protein SoxY
MTTASRVLVLDRRNFLLSAGAAASLAGLIGLGGNAHAGERSAAFTQTLNELLDGATPVAGGIQMDLPEQVENGDYVPLALSVDSPMTPQDHVKAIHLLSTANPRAHVATFRFTLLSGKARVTSRMRLAKTQEVVALAELSDGRILMSQTNVDVKVGGCGL